MKLLSYIQPTPALLSEIEAFVEGHPKGNFFQSADCFRFFSEVDNYCPVLITAYEGQKLKGSMIAVRIKEGNGVKGFFSKRCLVYGGPLAEHDNFDASEVAEAMLKKLSLQSKSIYIEFRNFFAVEVIENIFSKQKFEYVPYLNYLIRLDDEEKVFARFKSEKRRQIRKAFKEGARIEQAKNIEEVQAFYHILSMIYKGKVRKPLPPFNFFERFFSLKTGKILLTKFEDSITGGAMLPVFKNKIIYDWYRGGDDVTYKNLYPSTLAVWAGIKYGLDNGFELYDFMGAGKPNEEYGVRKFKSQFGGDLVEFGRFIKVDKPVIFKIGKLGLRCLNKLT